MVFEQYENAGVFRSAVSGLLADEARCNFLIGLIDGLAEHGWRGRYPAPPLMAAGYDEERRAVVAMVRTPPHNVVLSDCPARAATEAAAWLGHEKIEVPGVLAPRPAGEAFAQEWARLSGARADLRAMLRTHQLTRVIPPQGIPGRLRIADESQADLLAGWITAFDREVHHQPQDAPAYVRRYLATGSLFVWEDSATVAMATRASTTPNGARVSYVYTPPEHRRKGYASALVAALSQHLLDTGRRFCFLFTNVANPTSNHIYHAVGYEPVCDFVEYRFG